MSRREGPTLVNRWDSDGQRWECGECMHFGWTEYYKQVVPTTPAEFHACRHPAVHREKPWRRIARFTGEAPSWCPLHPNR